MGKLGLYKHFFGGPEKLRCFVGLFLHLVQANHVLLVELLCKREGFYWFGTMRDLQSKVQENSPSCIMEIIIKQWVSGWFHYSMGASINLLALTCSTCISISLFLKWLLLFYISLLLHSSFSSFAYGPFVLGYFQCIHTFQYLFNFVDSFPLDCFNTVSLCSL